MKIAGIALIWVGVVYLLKNIGIIQVVDWNIIWPVLVIIAGFAVKHCKHSMSCGMGGKCGMCGTGDSKKCEGGKCGGAGCGECKK